MSFITAIAAICDKRNPARFFYYLIMDNDCDPLSAAIPQPGVALTANGQPDLLCISTLSTANGQLQWAVSGVSGCVAASAPDPALWSGSKNDSGSESLTLSAGMFDFLY